MQRTHRIGIGMLALALFASGCYGPFNLTRRLYRWNGQVNGKWEKEFMFLILAFTQIYSIIAAGDAIVFNSMEFWTGNNPVDPPMGGKGALPEPKTKRIVRGTDEAVLTYTPTSEGAKLLIQQFRSGHPAGSVVIQQRDGITVGLDDAGNVLLTAQSGADGGVLVRDGSGKRIASYSGDEVERFVGSIRH